MLLFACWHANPFCSNHGSALFSTLHAVLIAPITKEFVVFSSFLQYYCQHEDVSMFMVITVIYNGITFKFVWSYGAEFCPIRVRQQW